MSTAKLNDSETEVLLALSRDESNLAVAAFNCSLYLEVSLKVVLLALSGDESNLAVTAFDCSLYLEVSLRVERILILELTMFYSYFLQLSNGMTAVCSPYLATSLI